MKMYLQAGDLTADHVGWYLEGSRLGHAEIVLISHSKLSTRIRCTYMQESYWAGEKKFTKNSAEMAYRHDTTVEIRKFEE